MMFLHPETPGEAVLAISQPMHAWVAGQILRHWGTTLDAALLLAAEQHDIAWLDWELSPGFDARTGRPSRFQDVGAAAHAPLWSRGVDRALAAWGSRVALLISRHGGVIYTRFTGRHRLAPADAAAAARYLAEEAPRQAAWAAALGADAAGLGRDSELIAFADTLSLALCGALPVPLELDGPGEHDGTQRYRLEHGGRSGTFTLDPWPCGGDRFTIQAEARAMPGGGFADAPAMQAWLASAGPVPVRITLARAGGIAARPHPASATRLDAEGARGG